MTTTHAHPAPTTRRPPPRATRRAQARAQARLPHHRRRWPGWVVAGLIALAAVAVVAIGGRSTSPEAGGAARSFRLASTDGREVSLADYRGEAVLLYFNEGVGCDACFLQTAALEADPAFAGVELTLLPIVMNQAAEVKSELERFGVQTPYLSDPDGSVSRAYDTLGRGHHANLPGHTFVLVGPDGKVRWRGDYPGMWVEPSELVGSIKGLSD